MKKMKLMKVKRFSAIFMAAVITLSCGFFALAAPVASNNTSGSITVNAQATGRDFVAYEILRMTATGSSDGDSYVVAPGANAYLQAYLASKNVPLSGSTYKDSEIVNYIAGLNNAGVQALADDFAANADKTGYTQYHLIQGSTSGTTTSYNASGVNLGYYIIVDSAAGSSGYTPSIVMINTVNKDITITAKDTTTTGDKQVGLNNSGTISYSNISDYSIGQTVPYQLSAEIPADTNQKTGLHSFGVTLNDTLSTGLAYQQIDSITIKQNGVALDPASADYAAYLSHATLTIGSNAYTGAGITAAYSAIAGAASFSLNFDLFSKGNGSDFDLLNGKQIEILVNYSGEITSAAAINDPLTNTYTLTFGRNGDTTTITKTANVYTYGLQITKTDTDGAALAGATFVLQDSSNKYISFTHNTITGVYTVNGFSDTLPTDAAALAAYQLVSDSGGLIKINGVDAGNYTLTETIAPSGYNILTAPQGITVSPDNKNTNNYSGVTVQNSKAVILPFTGGAGTLLFSIGGSVIILGAAAFLLLNRKKLFKR